MLLTLHLHCTVLSLVTLRWQIWIVAALPLKILRIASSYFTTINKTNVKITYQSSLGVYHQDSWCVCVCVFPLRRVFSPWLMHCSLTVSGQRKTDKKKWFLLPWSHTPSPLISNPLTINTTTTSLPPLTVFRLTEWQTSSVSLYLH